MGVKWWSRDSRIILPHQFIRSLHKINSISLLMLSLVLSIATALRSRLGVSLRAFDNVNDALFRIAAQVDGGPCVAYIGEDGSGDFIEMVHNGIEYGDMQLIPEAYDVLKHFCGLSNHELAAIFDEWNRGELERFLNEITEEIFKIRDELTNEGGYSVDKILDKAGMKGTRKWIMQQAPELLMVAASLLMVAASLDCPVPELVEGGEGACELHTPGGWLEGC